MGLNIAQIGRGEVKRLQEIKVGPDGFVRFIDMMGSDKDIVDAARISYHLNKDSGNQIQKSDENLIRYLMRNSHTSPFEMTIFKFHIRIPMDAWRQMVRHRTASINEFSTRYSVAIDSAATTRPNDWRTQSKTNKQGSGEFVNSADGQAMTNDEREFHAYARRVYEDRLSKGVAREQARKDLPLSTYTEAIWKIDLHNLFHFLKLRMDHHAQQEIRQFANAIAAIVSHKVPVAWRAFQDYKLYSMELSVQEQVFLYEYLDGMFERAREILEKLPKSEGMDLIDKLRSILPNSRLKGAESMYNEIRDARAKEKAVSDG